MRPMPIQYSEAQDVKQLVDEITEILDLYHVVPQFVYCVRSKGSRSTRTIARIHGLGKIWQEALRRPPSYAIEVISEQYDMLGEGEKEKTLIHELLHIPKGFKGGFRPHKGFVDQKSVESLFRRLQEQRTIRRRNDKEHQDSELHP